MIKRDGSVVDFGHHSCFGLDIYQSIKTPIVVVVVDHEVLGCPKTLCGFVVL